MEILVTGATGFLGSHLVPALTRAGHSVRTTSRGPGDALNPQNWMPLLDGIDAVVHLAGIAHRKATDDEHQISNHFATAALAEACKLAVTKQLVFVSSIAAQTGPSSDSVIRETDPVSPTTTYGESKLNAEKAIQLLGVPFTILRPVAVYGHGARGNFRTLKKIAALPLPLPLASLDARRSVLSANNFNSAVLLVLGNPMAANETFALANKEPKTVPQMIADLRSGSCPGLFSMRPLERLLRRSPVWDKIGRPLIADTTKISKLGWAPVEGPVIA